MSKDRLTDAERRALETMACSARYVDAGKETATVDNHRTVHGATVRRLERRGLAKGRAEWPDGSPVSEADLVRHIREWSTRYTITRAGMKAIGWVGQAPPPATA